MTKKLGLGIGLATSALFIAGCSGVSVEQVEESTNDLHTTFQNIIDTNEQLTNLEADMDEQFKTVLAEDQELSSLQDESAEVVQNIADREAIVEESLAQVESITEQADFLQSYEGTDLPVETLQQVSDDFTAFSEQLNDHYTLYQDSLTEQRNYLADIAGDDANYENFASGLDQLNNNYLALQEETIELDQSLVAFNEHLASLEEVIASTRDDESASIIPTVNAEDADEDGSEEKEESEDAEETENADAEEGAEEATEYLTVTTESLLSIPDEFPQKFVYDSGVDIPYPEGGVKGVYATAHSAGGDRMDYLVDLINTTDLNSIVIDIKDDHGNITLDLQSDNELINEMTIDMVDTEELMTTLEENDIYPIARIVVFKDTLLAHERPDLSFTHADGSVWSNNNGDSFVNPYLKEIWDYNVEVAIQAAKLGFKDIQFDYVRFPEGFELLDRDLNYSHGHYGDDDLDVINMEYRNQAVTDFVAYSREQLQPYGVDVSVDIFGYAAVVRETPGIGQSFPGIAREVDVISSMIYPSHWGLGNLDVAIPDLDPYNVVNNYAKIELELLDELGDEAPITRPWIQDFTASYLGAGYYKPYGAQEVTEQVRALAENGIHEFLLWNAGNTYSEDATFTFE